jgi:hypothetical protein
MTIPYKALFLLPPRTRKRLGDDGWEFSSSHRLPASLPTCLAQALHLRRCPSYLGLDVFEGEGLKLTVTTDRRGVENVHVQARGWPRKELERALALDGVEVFVPDNQDWS